MSDFLLFWLAKPLAALILILGVIALALIAELPSIIRQAKCKHNGDASETSACDAICRQCGKNLGFIGTWRESRKQAAK